MSIPVDQYLVFISVVALIVMTPGPNLALLLGTTPGSGRLRGILMVCGFSAAILSHAVLALVGVGAVIAASAFLFTIMKIGGAAYLIWLGVNSLLSLRHLGTPTLPDYERRSFSGLSGAFLRGYLTNLLNPKPAVFYVAAFPQFLSGHQQDLLVNGVGLGLTHSAIAFAFYGTVVVLVGRITEYITRPKVAKAVHSVSGMALILLGGRLLMTKNPA